MACCSFVHCDPQRCFGHHQRRRVSVGALSEQPGSLRVDAGAEPCTDRRAGRAIPSWRDETFTCAPCSSRLLWRWPDGLASREEYSSGMPCTPRALDQPWVAPAACAGPARSAPASPPCRCPHGAPFFNKYSTICTCPVCAAASTAYSFQLAFDIQQVGVFFEQLFDHREVAMRIADELVYLNSW